MDVLLVMVDAGGNVPPFLEIGRELGRRGHRTRCLGPLSIQAATERCGMTFRPLEHGAGFDPLARLTAADGRAGLQRVFLDDGYGHDVTIEIERQRPDVIVIDCLLVGAQAAAEALAAPYALLLHTLPGFLKDRFTVAELNAVRARVRLPPIASNADLWALARRALVTSTPLLDDFDPRNHGSALPGLRYIGPVFEGDAANEQPPPTGLPDASQPLVLVGFSTTYMEQERTLGCVIDAVSELPVHGVVTTGPAVDVDSLPAAANLTVRRWLPHAAVLPRASVVVTHAGHGTVAMALSHGVPLLCLPLGRDQGFIARRVEDLGVGLALPAESPSSTVRAALTKLLEDPSYRQAAQRVGAAIRAAGPGAANAAAELEALVSER